MIKDVNYEVRTSPVVSIEESVKDTVEKIKEYHYTDFDNPRYYNIKWVKFLEEAQEIINYTGYLFEQRD